jgi:hypothetical protein
MESVATDFHFISEIRITEYCYPVATALGTDLITKLGRYSGAGWIQLDATRE